MSVLKKFSLGRVALPLATLAALTGAILVYVIRGKYYVFLHGCFLIYIVFGSIRTYIAYKKEGAFNQLIKDLLITSLGIIILFLLGICLGCVID
jgi:L-lactate permease